MSSLDNPRYSEIARGVASQHEIILVFPSDIDGTIDLAAGEEFLEGFFESEFAVVECSCEWQSTPFINDSPYTAEEIHRLHLNEKVLESVLD